MNSEELNNAIIVLADKLGVTAEYLWDVLIKQAPISAIVRKKNPVYRVFELVGNDRKPEPGEFYTDVAENIFGIGSNLEWKYIYKELSPEEIKKLVND